MGSFSGLARVWVKFWSSPEVNTPVQELLHKAVSKHRYDIPLVHLNTSSFGSMTVSFSVSGQKKKVLQLHLNQLRKLHLAE